MASTHAPLLRLILPSALALAFTLGSAWAQGTAGLRSAGFFLAGSPSSEAEVFEHPDYEEEEQEARYHEALLGELSSRVELFYLFLNEGKETEALKEMDRIEAMDLDEDLEATEMVAGAYLEAAEYLHESGKSQKAEAMLRKGLDRNPGVSNSRGHLLGALAHMLRDLDRSEEAMQLLQESIEVFSKVRAQLQD